LVASLVSTWQAVRATRAFRSETASRQEAQLAQRVAQQERSTAQEQRDRARAAEQLAEANFAKAREAVDRLFTQVAEEIQWEPHMEHVRRTLLEYALEFYLGFLDQKGDDPGIRLETAYAYGRVGDIHRALGELPKAVDAYRQGHELLEALQRDYGNDPSYRNEAAHSYFRLGKSLTDNNRLDEAGRCYDQALTLWTDLADDLPKNPEYRKRIAHWYIARGDSLIVTERRRVEAEKLIRQGLAELDRLQADFPNQPDDLSLRAWAFNRLGKALISSGRFHASEEMFRKARSLQEQIARQQGRPKAPTDHFINYYLAGLALYHNRPEEAERLSRAAVAHYEAMSERYPGIALYWGELHKHSGNLRNTLTAMGRLDEAEQVARRHVESARSVLGQQPRAIGGRTSLAWATYELAHVLFVAGRHQEAADAYRSAIKVFEELAAEYPDVGRHQNHLAFVLAACPAKPCRDPRRAISFAKRALELAPEDVDSWSTLGMVQVAAANYHEAIQSYETARRYAGGELPLYTRLPLGLAYWHTGDKQRGREIYDQVVQELENKPVPTELRVFRGEVEEAMGIERHDANDQSPE
jgi:tetratricopeptide (TPR) repeat protein